MSKRLTRKAIRLDQKVEGGRPFSEDYDQGKIIGFDDETGYVTVSWKGSLEITTQDYSGLRLGWSERWPSVDDE